MVALVGGEESVMCRNLILCNVEWLHQNRVWYGFGVLLSVHLIKVGARFLSLSYFICSLFDQVVCTLLSSVRLFCLLRSHDSAHILSIIMSGGT